jgi:hypothetical protein
MFPLLVAVKLAGDGVTVQTVEGTADAGATAMAKAAAPAPATTAILVRGFFMRWGLPCELTGGRGSRP